MSSKHLAYLLALIPALILSGCVVRTYPLIKERMDQELVPGNRGYLKGQAPQAGPTREKKVTRTTQVVEIELHSPIRFEKSPKGKTEPKEKKENIIGNRGFITESYAPEIMEPAHADATTPAGNMQKYVVQKGDTLQKISKAFYGTTRKWAKIYGANKEALKGPNSIYPGQAINVPAEPLKKFDSNLK